MIEWSTIVDSVMHSDLCTIMNEKQNPTFWGSTNLVSSRVVLMTLQTSLHSFSLYYLEAAAAIIKSKGSLRNALGYIDDLLVSVFAPLVQWSL